MDSIFSNLQSIFAFLFLIVILICIFYLIIKKAKSKTVKFFLLGGIAISIIFEILFKSYNFENYIIQDFLFAILTYSLLITLIIYMVINSSRSTIVKRRLTALLIMDFLLLTTLKLLITPDLEFAYNTLSLMLIPFLVVTILSISKKYNIALEKSKRFTILTTTSVIASSILFWCLSIMTFSWKSPLYVTTFVLFFIVTQVTIQLVRKLFKSY